MLLGLTPGAFDPWCFRPLVLSTPGAFRDRRSFTIPRRSKKRSAAPKTWLKGECGRGILAKGDAADFRDVVARRRDGYPDAGERPAGDYRPSDRPQKRFCPRPMNTKSRAGCSSGRTVKSRCATGWESSPATTIEMASARCMSTNSRSSARCSVPSSHLTEGSRGRACRRTWATSSLAHNVRAREKRLLGALIGQLLLPPRNPS